MDKEKVFLFYERWYEQMKCLPDAERLKVYDSICEYAFNHIITDLVYYLECVMNNIRKQIDCNEEKRKEISDKRRNAIKSRWINTNEYKRIQKNTNEYKQLQGDTNDTIIKNIKDKTENIKDKTENIKDKTENIKDKSNSSSLHSEENKENNIIESAKAASTSSQADDAANAATIKIVRSDKEKEILGLYKEVAEYFNKAMDGKQIQKIKKLNDFRKAHIAARLKDFSKQDVFEVIDKAAASDFLNGCGRNGFKATFDWIFRPNNFPKILEGNYDNGNNNKQQPQNGNTGYDNGREQRRKEFAEHVAKLLAQPNDETDDLPEALRDC